MGKKEMNEIEFSALMVSRVCHDLVGPMGAVINGLEVLEDERDPAMREEAIKLISSSATQALARIQFMRIAFGAAGSAGAELDLGEIGRLIAGLLEGGKIKLEWQAPHAYWGKDWAKLLMNAALLGADSLPRGGTVVVTAGDDPKAPTFKVVATGLAARLSEDVAQILKGEQIQGPVDARAIQPHLTYRLARTVNAGLAVTVSEGSVVITAG
jgi:histidine phosphotransferase ChpT